MVGIIRWCSKSPEGQAVARRGAPEGFATAPPAVDGLVLGDLTCRLSCTGPFSQMGVEPVVGAGASWGAHVVARLAAASRKLSRMYNIRSAWGSVSEQYLIIDKACEIQVL